VAVEIGEILPVMEPASMIVKAWRDFPVVVELVSPRLASDQKQMDFDCRSVGQCVGRKKAIEM